MRDEAIKLFDIENGQVVPTKHCYTIVCLKRIMDEFPTEYLKIYAFFHYVTYPYPEDNPFFYTPILDKEQVVYKQVGAEFSLEDETIIEAWDFCKTLYNTPTVRAYKGITAMVEKIATYMETESINGDNRDGNGGFILRATKDFSDIRKTYKETFNDLIEEQQSKVRGNQNLGYDQM